jgi:hypothetical protein
LIQQAFKFFYSGSRSFILKITHIIGVNTAANELFSLRHKIVTFFQALSFIPQINGLLQVWPDPVKVCHSMMFYVFATELLTIGISRFVHNDAKTVPEINGTVDDFYIRQEKDQKFRLMLIPFADLCYSIIKWFTIFMIILFHVPIIVTWTSTIVTGEFYYIAPFYFPFIDPQTLAGFLINQTYMTFLLISVFITHSPLITWYLYLTLQIIPMVDIFNRKLDMLSKNLILFRNSKKSEKSQKKDLKSSLAKVRQVASIPVKLATQSVKQKDQLSIEQLEKQFIKIIQEFSIYNSFIQRILNLMKWSTCVTFSVSSIGIGMSIILIKYSTVSIGLASAILFTVQVLIQCIQGSIVVHQNEKILESLCGFPWYELPKPQHKIFMQFIHVCQNGCVLEIPIIGELNMELFTSVMNGTYSLFMYLLKFTKS